MTYYEFHMDSDADPYCHDVRIIYKKKTKSDMAKKEGIRKLFDNIAPDYDRLNHILSLNIDKGWRKKAVREIADENRPMNVLDVACGTADFTIEIAQKVAHGSIVTGVDISEGMMAVGKEKINQPEHGNQYQIRKVRINLIQRNGNQERNGIQKNEK